MNAYRGPEMTLGNAAASRVRIVVWCTDCQHQVEPDPGELVARYGAETPVRVWHARLVCGGRKIDSVATGTERR